MSNLANAFQETHTWQYFLFVDPLSCNGCNYAQELFQLCPDFATNCSLEVTEFDQEDWQRLQQFLEKRNLHSRVERFLRPCDD
jgi:hypothetical protein